MKVESLRMRENQELKNVSFEIEIFNATRWTGKETVISFSLEKEIELLEILKRREQERIQDVNLEDGSDFDWKLHQHAQQFDKLDPFNN